MNNVNHVTGGNTFCGPGALSALAGISTLDADVLLKHIRSEASGKKVTKIKGVHLTEMETAFQLLGLKAVKISTAKKGKYPTVKTWRTDKTRPMKGRLLLYVTGHYISVEGNHMWDNNVKPEGIPLADWKQRTQVRAYWKVSGRTNRKELNKIVKAANTPKPVVKKDTKDLTADEDAKRIRRNEMVNANRAAKKQAERFAKANGWTAGHDKDGCWVNDEKGNLIVGKDRYTFDQSCEMWDALYVCAAAVADKAA